MREETERLVKEALERKTLTVKQSKTRIVSTVKARAEWQGGRFIVRLCSDLIPK